MHDSGVMSATFSGPSGTAGAAMEQMECVIIKSTIMVIDSAHGVQEEFLVLTR